MVPPFDPLQLHVHPVPVSVTVVGVPVEQRVVVGEVLARRLLAVQQIPLMRGSVLQSTPVYPPVQLNGQVLVVRAVEVV